MGIRDTTYYGWQNIDLQESVPGKQVIVVNNAVAIDPSNKDIIYVGGYELVYPAINFYWFVKRTINKGKTWEIIDYIGSTSQVHDMVVDSNGVIYVVGSQGITEWLVRKSTTGASGSFIDVDAFPGPGGGSHAYGVCVDSSDNVYVCGGEEVTSQGENIVVRKSTTGASGSFSYIDSYDSGNGSDSARCITADSNDAIYIGGLESGSLGDLGIIRASSDGSSGSFSTVGSPAEIVNDIVTDSSGKVYAAVGSAVDWVVLSSSDGSSGSFAVVDSFDLAGEADLAQGIDADSNDVIYVCGYTTETDSTTNWVVRRSTTGKLNSFVEVDKFKSPPSEAWLSQYSVASSVAIDSDDVIYVTGWQGAKGATRRGKWTANSASIGPRMLATSFGYVHEEISGSTREKFKLNNISEFPHSSGLYQMPNVLLGTTDSGKLGKDDNSIIQINYFGSVVKIMWPKQEGSNNFVKGFGDFSLGQKPGKLSTTFDPGDFIDVSKFDHMKLYCYLIKDISGTLDNVDVRIEQRPLRNTGFTTEHISSGSFSGSYALENLKEHLYRRQVDYGDLSIKEIGYPIDVPLKNVREVRVSARQVTGQSSDTNKNFVVWGRFINSSEEN